VPSRLESTRAAYVAQQHNVAAWLESLPAPAWDRPSRLGEWSVRELGFHVTDMTGVVVQSLAQGSVKDKPLTIAAYTSAWKDSGAEIAERDKHNAAGLDRDGVLRNAEQAKTDLLTALDAVTEENPTVLGRRGPLRLADLMVTRINELVTHSLDLSASVPDVTPVELDHGALGVACRMLTGILAERAPGHTVELRVPPYAAIQCVAGPRHTRGTPPNVVEVDAVTWIELATGRRSWTDAFAAGKIAASGERSDISEHLPVLS
jgi:uncharacterized protein (TIGR03083 family)